MREWNKLVELDKLGEWGKLCEWDDLDDIRLLSKVVKANETEKLLMKFRN